LIDCLSSHLSFVAVIGIKPIGVWINPEQVQV
jgi:hypothetical protein